MAAIGAPKRVIEDEPALPVMPVFTPGKRTETPEHETVREPALVPSRREIGPQRDGLHYPAREA